jgi:hypothetical protein
VRGTGVQSGLFAAGQFGESFGHGMVGHRFEG